MINLKSKDLVPVAILGTPDFNVAINSVKFAGASLVGFSFEDVNRNGRIDLLFISIPRLCNVHRVVKTEL